MCNMLALGTSWELVFTHLMFDYKMGLRITKFNSKTQALKITITTDVII